MIVTKPSYNEIHRTTTENGYVVSMVHIPDSDIYHIIVGKDNVEMICGIAQQYQDAYSIYEEIAEEVAAPIGSLDYKGYHIDFFCDDYGQQAWTVFEGEMYGFGAYNVGYEEDMKEIIERKQNAN